jgi:diguanylate cyclase (GGDEF)-like protein/PAS domain S-box-containing protein
MTLENRRGIRRTARRTLLPGRSAPVTAAARLSAGERFQALVQHASDIITILDADGVIVYESPAIERVLGYTPEETVGGRALAIAHPEDVPTGRAMYDAVRAAPGATQRAEMRFLHRDGSLRHLELVATNLLDDPRVRGIVVNARDITERKQTEEALRAAERKYRALVEQVPAVTYLQASDASASAIYMSPQIEALVGYTPEQWLDDPDLWLKTIHPDDRERVLVEHLRTNDTGDPFRMEYRMVATDGRVVWVRDDGVLVRDDADRPLYWQGVFLDITERKQADQALAISERRFRGAFEYATVGMSLATPDGRFLRVNRAFCDMLGYSEEELLELSFRQVTHAADLETDVELRRQLLAGEIPAFQTEKRYVHKEGYDVWAILSVSLVHDADGQPLYVVGQAQDITDRKLLEQRLAHQAFHDALTGLPNRALFMDRLEHALNRAARQEETVAVLFLDLDGFKAVNDRLGHAAGDELLVQAGQRLHGWVRAADTVARLGGDEFTVLLERVRGQDEVIQIAERIVGGMAEPFRLGNLAVVVRTSVGVAFTAAQGFMPGTPAAPSDLLRNADVALYRAKAAGGGRYVLYDAQDEPRALELVNLRASY